MTTGTTPLLKLPYPNGDDPIVNGDDQIKALATMLDTVVGQSASGVYLYTLATTTSYASFTITLPAGRFADVTNLAATASAASTSILVSPQVNSATALRIGLRDYEAGNLALATYTIYWIASRRG